MNRLLVLVITLILTLALTTPAALAGGQANVVATFTVADLGQGLWGGGPLYADYTAGGNIPASLNNGQTVFQIQPTRWSWIVPGVVLDLCFVVREMKGASGLPPAFCASDFGAGLLVTGTPVRLPAADGPGFIVRVTLTR